MPWNSFGIGWLWDDWKSCHYRSRRHYCCSAIWNLPDEQYFVGVVLLLTLVLPLNSTGILTKREANCIFRDKNKKERIKNQQKNRIRKGEIKLKENSKWEQKIINAIWSFWMALELPVVDVRTISVDFGIGVDVSTSGAFFLIITGIWTVCSLTTPIWSRKRDKNDGRRKWEIY